MPTQLLALGVIGVRLYERILISPVQYSDELADHIIDEINYYLPMAPLREKNVLFHLACEIHAALEECDKDINSIAGRHQVVVIVSRLIVQSKKYSHLYHD
ncbi:MULTISPECIES: hypothetical protein [unclassified Iodobacter]|uniref:hypothetical protein n=1 Tax=unclassified Iodobacter TaxID=235634 RepID=UPI0025D52AB8|nr:MULTISPECIES: hypothetical protein [unclassified Iodobacter]MDW5415951.1 hypothetical protein [Iodobacter sp. CM08]